jgi:hypothetical protein
MDIWQGKCVVDVICNKVGFCNKKVWRCSNQEKVMEVRTCNYYICSRLNLKILKSSWFKLWNKTKGTKLIANRENKYYIISSIIYEPSHDHNIWLSFISSHLAGSTKTTSEDRSSFCLLNLNSISIRLLLSILLILFSSLRQF